MDLAGTRGNRGPLTSDERRRRADNNLCAYYGQSSHPIATRPGVRTTPYSASASIVSTPIPL